MGVGQREGTSQGVGVGEIGEGGTEVSAESTATAETVSRVGGGKAVGVPDALVPSSPKLNG